MTDLKVLAIDIECSAALVYTYGLFNQNISYKHIKEHPRIMCFSAQWLGTKKTMFFSEYHDGKEAMLQKLHDLMDEADVVMGYNSQRFDVPWIEGYLLEEGYDRPSPVKHIDLLSVFRKHSRYISRKLDYVSDKLLDDKKVSVSTLDLQIECESDDPEVQRKAWAKMKRYSVKDTALMLPLFERVKSYVKMPHPIVGSSEEALCHACGSDKLERRGYALTQTGRYQRFHCNDCGSWFRGTQRVSESPIRAL